MIIPVIGAFHILAGPPQLYTAAQARLEVSAPNVMVRGTISSIGTGAFAIGEHTIYIDPAKTGSFRQMGTIETGARAEVKARRVDNLLYAEQIVIVGTGQGRTQIVVKANQQGTLESLGVYLKNAVKLFTSVSI